MVQQQQAVTGQSAAADEARQHYARGVRLLKQREVQSALSELSRAVKLQPVFPEALRAMGLAFKARGENAKAQKFLNAAAVAWVRRNELDKAVKQYEACKQAGLAARNPFQVLANTLHEKGKAAKALKYYEKALELTPEDDMLASSFGRALADSGHMEQAQRFMRSYLQQYPDSPRIARLLQDFPKPDKNSPVWKDVAPDSGQTGAPQAKPASDTRDEIMSKALQGETVYDENGFAIEVDGSDIPVSAVPEPPVQRIVEQKKDEHCEKRRSRRIPLADFFLRFPKRKEHQPVVDICREGIGFKHGDLPVRRGQELQFDLMALEKVKVKKLHAVVRHITHGHVGCEFLELSRKQLKILDKIVSALEEDSSASRETPLEQSDKVCFDLDMW